MRNSRIKFEYFYIRSQNCIDLILETEIYIDRSKFSLSNGNSCSHDETSWENHSGLNQIVYSRSWIGINPRVAQSTEVSFPGINFQIA